MDNIKEFERRIKAVANGRRLKILKYLKTGKKISVGDIADLINLSIKSTSRHLQVLFSSNIVERDQRSVEVYYWLSDSLTPEIRVILNEL